MKLEMKRCDEDEAWGLTALSKSGMLKLSDSLFQQKFIWLQIYPKEMGASISNSH